MQTDCGDALGSNRCETLRDRERAVLSVEDGYVRWTKRGGDDVGDVQV